MTLILLLGGKGSTAAVSDFTISESVIPERSEWTVTPAAITRVSTADMEIKTVTVK